MRDRCPPLVSAVRQGLRRARVLLGSEQVLRTAKWTSNRGADHVLYRRLICACEVSFCTLVGTAMKLIQLSSSERSAYVAERQQRAF